MFLSLLSLLSRQCRAQVKTHLKSLNLSIVLGCIVLFFIISLIGIQQVIWADTGLYHTGAIKWMAQYGLVKGLALLQIRYGLVSSWFCLAAPFHFWIFEGRMYSFFGTFCLLISILHLSISFSRMLQGKNKENVY